MPENKSCIRLNALYVSRPLALHLSNLPPMKLSILSPSDKALVQSIAVCLMACNERNDVNASDMNARGTYGHLHKAIESFVLNQTGIDISKTDWNLGGNRTWADDIQQAIDDTIAELARQAEQARLYAQDTAAGHIIDPYYGVGGTAAWDKLERERLERGS